jgi:hypothetical protein
MSQTRPLAGCARCPMTRRKFLASGAALAGAGALHVPGAEAGRPPAERAKVRIVYALHGPRQKDPDWPNKGFDFAPVMERYTAELAKRCPTVSFVISMANGPEAAAKIVEGDRDAGIDGYLVWQMNCWNRVVQTMAATGKPVLYADFQFGGSGGFLAYTAGFIRANAPNVGFVASSRLEDVAAAANALAAVTHGGSVSDFVAATARLRAERTPARRDVSPKTDAIEANSPDECLRRMKASKILAVRDNTSGPGAPLMGIPVEQVSYAEVNDAWNAADKGTARAVADDWAKRATRVAGIPRETLETSAAMYLGMKDVLKRHGANAITINCLGGFYGGHIHAYPCLGFFELNNEGLVGGCEGDLRSASTMVVLGALAGRPGYISDPVIDTSKRQIIYAHCVASNRVFGPKAAANAFEILTHSEDRQGASVRSLMPVGYVTTTVEFEPSKKQVLFHRARTVANDPDDRACRTKLAAEPLGDVERLFAQWDQWGWHRVTCYGDLKEPIFALAGAMGWAVVDEA